MNFKEIQELIKLITKSNLTEFKLKEGEFQLSIRTKRYGKGKGQTVITTPQQQILPVQAAAVQPTFQQAPPAPQAAKDTAKSSASNEADEAAKTDEYVEVRSPIVGTFYRASSPDKPPFIKVGDVVDVGSVVCIVEAMKLFNEIESEVSGKVVKVLIEDASPVEYDQVLFLLDPKG